MAKATIGEEILKELDHGCKIVQLTLFKHQVGGHHVFLMYDKNKILKHLCENERDIYEGFPDHLKGFIPKFYGKIASNLLFYSEERNQSTFLYSL